MQENTQIENAPTKFNCEENLLAKSTTPMNYYAHTSVHISTARVVALSTIPACGKGDMCQVSNIESSHRDKKCRNTQLALVGSGSKFGQSGKTHKISNIKI